MKYEKTLAVLAGLTFAGSIAQAQIAIGETLTVSGFADASYVNNDDGTETSDFGIDQVEVDLAFSLDNFSWLLLQLSSPSNHRLKIYCLTWLHRRSDDDLQRYWF